MAAVEQATFVERVRCIACGQTDHREVASGAYLDEPLRSFIARDPWGSSPLPHLQEATWSYVECGACGQRFHRRVLSPEWNERRFRKWMTREAIESFEVSAGSDPALKLRRGQTHVCHALQIEHMTRAQRGGRPARVLDFGCGWGHFLSVCRSFGFEAHGVDRSAARREKNAGVQVFASLEEISGHHDAPQGYDAVTLFEVLEHLDDPSALLERLVQVLAPGGMLVLETPDCSGVEGISVERDYRLIHPLDHINGFTPSTLRAMASRFGCKPIRPPACIATTSLWAAAKRAIKRGFGPVLRPTTQIYLRKT